jgi:hypothetical protein
MLTDAQQILADREAATCDPHPYHPLTEHLGFALREPCC